MVRSGRSSSICDRYGVSIPMVILPKRIFSASRSFILEGWGQKHLLALAEAASQDRPFRIGRVIRVWI